MRLTLLGRLRDWLRMAAFGRKSVSWTYLSWERSPEKPKSCQRTDESAYPATKGLTVDLVRVPALYLRRERRGGD